MSPNRGSNDDSFVCPACGAEVPAGKDFCRACGASDEFGWDEDGREWDDDLPAGYSGDDDFDYDDFVRRELPGERPEWSKYQAKRLLLALLVLLVCAALLVWTILP
ncbi:MAG: zinc ribbon domain-containing protein [Planctomycetota bacterium]|jgi:hypothetical protein